MEWTASENVVTSAFNDLLYDGEEIEHVWDVTEVFIKEEPYDMKWLMSEECSSPENPHLMCPEPPSRSPSPSMAEQPYLSSSATPASSRSPSPSTSEPPLNHVEPVAIVGERGGGGDGDGGGGARGSRGGRGRGRGRGGGRSGARVRHSGVGGDTRRRADTIREIYVNDDDVPADLREAIVDVYRKREARRTLADRRVARGRRGDEDAHDGDAALFPGDEDALHFDWRPMDSYRGERESFLPKETGSTTASGSAYEAFSQYWDHTILMHIVSETNRYAVTLGHKDWYDTNVHEILVLFAFWMMLGIIRMPSIKSCFSEHFLLSTTCFRLMFGRQRYQRLCSALHFNDDSLHTPQSSQIFSIEPILSHLNARFQAAYVPRQEICIDDTLTLWKGDLPIRQYIPAKTAKLGIKTYELCESATGYLWSFFVYTGKNCNPDPSLSTSLLKSTAAVVTLIRPLLNKGYTLFIDHSLNSPLLARFLKKNRTDVVGTLTINHKDVPPLVMHCVLQPGEFAARHSGDMMVMAFHDRKKIVLLSTYHGTKVVQCPSKPHRSTPSKPQLIFDHNKCIGGVGLKNGMLNSYELERKRCAKWDMKLFKRLLNCSILNSRICREATIGKRIDHFVFRLELVEQILNTHLNLVPRPRRPAPKPETTVPDSRFTQNRHWPSLIIKRDAKGHIMRRCCAQKRCTRRPTFECKLCDVGLCPDVCFARYHTPP